MPHDDIPTQGETGLSEEALLHELQMEEFKALDWMLYLDTHPDDPQAWEHYRHHAARSRELMAEYVERHGPLIWMDPVWPGPGRGVPWA